MYSTIPLSRETHTDKVRLPSSTPSLETHLKLVLLAAVTAPYDGAQSATSDNIRRIAALLPGRSDDAVRNRWNRLKAEQGLTGPLASEAPPPAAKRAASTSSDGASKPERVSWTKAEDATILSSVQELGHKWNKLAERLPGRTDHAIRNRFHRLQTMLEDKQREQQRMLAPAEPLPPHIMLA